MIDVNNNNTMSRPLDRNDLDKLRYLNGLINETIFSCCFEGSTEQTRYGIHVANVLLKAFDLIDVLEPDMFTGVHSFEKTNS